MTGVLVLVGSGEFTAAMAEVDRFLLRKLRKPKVAILPTAAGREPYQKWIDDGVRHFKNLGVEVEGVHLLSAADASNPKIANKLSDFNFYYFSGGDPGYLLNTLKDFLACQTIFGQFRAGATLVGASAGAMVLGKMLWARVYDYLNNSVLKPWEPGLGIVDFGVIPHYDAAQGEFTKEQWQQIIGIIPKELKVLGVDEDTAYIRVSKKWQVMGKGEVHILEKKIER